MKRVLVRASFAVAATVAAAAVVATSGAPATAHHAPSKVTETGCYDITAGAPQYVQDTFDHDQQSLTDEVRLNSGVVRADLALAAPSCLDTVYGVTVFAHDPATEGPGDEIGYLERHGDGAVSGVVSFDVPVHYRGSCIWASVRVLVDGVVPDTGDPVKDCDDNAVPGGASWG